MSGVIVGGTVLLLSLLVGGTWVRSTRAKAELAAKYPPPGQMVDVGGYRLHINCQGEGRPTVVMDAGHSEPSLSWALVQQEVAKFTRVCTYDRAGLGWSERSPKPRTASNIIEGLHTLLTQAGVEPPYILVGHSIGGMYVRLYAHEHPEQVAGMVLVDARHEEQDSRLPAIVQQLDRRTYKQLTWIMRLFQMLNSIGILARSPDELGSRWPAPIPETVREAYLGVVCSDTRFFKTFIEETAVIEENSAQVRAAQITTLGDIPLVVLSAPDQYAAVEGYLSAEDVEQVRAVMDELNAELAALSSNGRQVVVRESGHYIQVEQPEAVIDAIRQVVEAVRR